MRMVPFVLAFVLPLLALSGCGGGSSAADTTTPPGTDVPAQPQPQPITPRLTELTSAPVSSIAHGNGIYVAAANGGVATSPDAVTWTLQKRFSDSLVDKVMHNGAQFIALAGGRIFTSSDGAAWSRRDLGAESVAGMVQGGSVLVALTSAGKIFSSADGSVWTERASDPGMARDLTSIGGRMAAGGGRFVLLGSRGRLAASADGIQWTFRDLPLTRGVWGLEYGNGQFVLLSSAPPQFMGSGPLPGTELLSSADGVTWTLRYSEAPGWYRTMVFGNGRFVAAGENGVVLTSTDGIAWTRHTPNFTEAIDTVSFGNGRFVAIGFAGDVSTSADGIAWTASPAGLKGNAGVKNLGYSGNRYFAVVYTDRANSGDYWPERLASSTDGLAWTLVDVVAKDGMFLRDVAYGNGMFVSAGWSVLSSSDAEAWTLNVPEDRTTWTTWESVAYIGGRFIVVGGNAGTTEAPILTSTDGRAWTKVMTDTRNNLRASAYGNGQYIAVGYNPGAGTVVGSSDGLNWSTRASGLPYLTGVAFGGGRFVAVGFDASGKGRVVTSTDGFNWSELAAQVPHLNAVTYANGMFVAVGANVILSSADGLRWTTRSTMPNWFERVTWGGGQFVAAGIGTGGGKYVTSANGIDWTEHVYPPGAISATAWGNGSWVLLNRDKGILLSP
ncbi:MAG TPA: hypothetical protein VEC01_09645 [Noviherbaspirillum sp.]|uniref:hypothetical protein n=1 Tax=Noviherbaspirillum sp. TaxID=1926288 RepID=UPI002D22D7C6|nr:hypothetical protein [Noviherbaspirillum sp.]HYD95574.1 hypothetical protein [Noviherbaspirillum sp.]